MRFPHKFSSAVLIITALFLLCIIQSCSNHGELYAVKYGESKFASPFITLDGEKNTSKNFHWLFYIYKTKKHIYLIDTGYRNPKWNAIFNVKWTDPIQLLSQLKISPEEITDIIITHHHFDHSENLDYFTNAKIYMNTETYKILSASPQLKPFLTETKNNSKIHILDNFSQMEIGKTIIYRHIGGHSKDSCIVIINDKEKILIPGDEIYIKDNYNPSVKGVGTYYNSTKNIDFINEAIELDYSIYPFHDPEICKDKTIQQIF